MIKLLRTVAMTTLTCAPTTVLSDAWTCEQSGLIREVTVYYPNAPAVLPCEVYYSKPSENTLPKGLWNAQYEAGYCERKAREFVTTLEQLGWNCHSTPAAPADG